MNPISIMNKIAELLFPAIGVMILVAAFVTSRKGGSDVKNSANRGLVQIIAVLTAGLFFCLPVLARTTPNTINYFGNSGGTNANMQAPSMDLPTIGSVPSAGK